MNDASAADTMISDAAAAMYASDEASRALGIELIAASEGRAITVMTVEARHCNGLGVCHGGLIFTLADTAMAFASNADGSGSFATHADVDFVRGGRLGDRLTAAANRIVKRGKSSVNDVFVTNQDGDVVATFRGRTLATGAAVGPATDPG